MTQLKALWQNKELADLLKGYIKASLQNIAVEHLFSAGKMTKTWEIKSEAIARTSDILEEVFSRMDTEFSGENKKNGNLNESR